MSIQSEINRIKASVASAYEAAKSKGAVAPELEDVANLASTILTITSGGGDVPLGNKMYTFGVLSDIHLKSNNYNHGIDDFNRAILCMQNLGAEFVGIAGDLGHAGTDDELVLYQNALNTYASIPFHIIRGNHDVKFTEQNWITYTGFASNHEFIYNGDVFLFLSRDISTDMSNTQATPYANGLTWIKERLERYKGSRIFLFCHYPPSGYSGLVDGQYYGWSSASTEDDELVGAIMQTKNVILFTGHTHYKFQVEEEYDNINIYRFNASKSAFIHVPSSAYPRNATSGVEEALSQGYLVDVYENGIVINGIDLVSGQPMLDYEYVIAVDNNQSASANAIIIENSDISIDAGESVQIGVKLDAPANAVVNVSANNINVTVSPATLTFTESNHSTMQYITITGASDVGNNATSIVTLSADGFNNRTVSVTLGEIILTETVAGSNTIVDGAAYGGTYSDRMLSFPDAGTFNIKFVNLNMSYSTTPVLIKGNPTNGTINVYGMNTLTSANNRGISSSSTTPINLIGVGNGASLLVKGGGSASAGLKGDWNVTNLDFIVETVKTPIDIISKGITIIGNGSVTMNTAKVEVLTSEYGALSVNLGAATAGSSAITITTTPDSGYKLSSILINGVDGSATQTMPVAGETMTIQGVFVIDDGQQEPEPEEPTSTVIELPWVDNMQAQTGATAEVENAACMTTMEYIPIESGYSYEVSTTTLGTLGLRVFFYTGTNYTNYLDRSIDIGRDIFPTQYSYTLIIPSGATHLRLRAKTGGDHQTWKDRIILTKIRNA